MPERLLGAWTLSANSEPNETNAPQACSALFYPFGLGLYRHLSQNEALALGIVAVAFQLAFAWAWFMRFQYGPLEWLWRCGTWLTWEIPIRRRVAFQPESDRVQAF
jgi:Protein of unknown function (DUF418)